MTSTRRSIFVFGALLAVGVLLAPQSALAQIVLTATQVNAGDDVTLSWTVGASTGTTHTSFDITWVVGGNLPNSTAAKRTASPATARTLMISVDEFMPSTAYTFAIRTSGDDGWEATGNDETDQVSLTTKAAAAAEKPAPPREVSSKAAGRDSIEVTWKPGVLTGAPSPEDLARIRYEIGWTTATTGTFVPSNTASVGRDDTKYVLKDLKVGEEYRVRVRSVRGNEAGTAVTRGDWMGTGSTMTPAAPGKPQNVDVTAGDGELMVTWNEVATVGDCKGSDTPKSCGYLVEWKASNQSYSNTDPDRHMELVGADPATEYTITGLTNGMEYSVRVSATNESTSGWVQSDYEARATPMAPKLAAPNPVEAMSGDGEVTVKWTAVEGATKYRIQWRTESQSYDSKRQREGFYAYRTGDLVLQDTVPDLMNGTKYMFQVLAMNDDGMSDPSDEVSATPMVPTPALPVFGALVLGAGLVAAGRRRLRARQRRLLKAS